MLLETISCSVCQGEDYKLIFKAKDFRLKTSSDTFNVVRCLKCSFIFLNPRPEKSIIANFYPPDFNRQDRTFLYRVIEPSFKIAQISIIKLIKKYKRKGKVLDIGCGNGDFLLAMQKNGFDIWGVEPNKKSEKFCSSYIKGRIFYSELKECHFKPATFDIITMFQSLEHVYDLNELLEEIKYILKDDGILYICIPNTDFFEAHFFGPYWYNLEIPRHLYFFTQKSLSNLLFKNGFQIVRFLKNSIFELVSTPASFYHGLWNFLADKDILTNSKLAKSLTFIPLVIIRLIFCLFFILQGQNLKAIFKNLEKKNA